jgi:hypothetical protein
MNYIPDTIHVRDNLPTAITIDGYNFLQELRDIISNLGEILTQIQPKVQNVTVFKDMDHTEIQYHGELVAWVKEFALVKDKNGFIAMEFYKNIKLEEIK